jgi:hypothetical protein
MVVHAGATFVFGELGPRTLPRRLDGGMRIAVIGTGNIGGSLGTKWRAAAYDVTFGARAASPDGPGGAEVLPMADALAARTVDGVLPLWFALVQQSGGDRKLAFRVVR